MVVLTDLAIALLILASVGFLGITGMALYRELKKDKSNEDN